MVLPIIGKTFRFEWTAGQYGSSDFLYHYRNFEKPLHPEIAAKLFKIMSVTKPGTLHNLDCGLGIFQRMTLSESQKNYLKKRALNQFEHFLEHDNKEFAMRYLVLLFQIDPPFALQKINCWIFAAKPEAQNELATQIIGGGFNRDDWWLIASSLKDAQIQTLKDLVSLAYRVISPTDDIRHNGVFTPDSRDRAESGRSAILSALHNSIGGDAYKAMIELADALEISGCKHRFRQLSRDMAERDAEFPAWTENETLMLENRHIAPIKNGDGSLSMRP